VLEEVEFAWDGAVLAEQTDGGRSTAWEWEPRSFRPAAQLDRGDGEGAASQQWHDARFYAIITDLVGTPAELVTASGEVAWEARASVWGIVSPSSANAADGQRCGKQL
jgi:hypothetical protein